MGKGFKIGSIVWALLIGIALILFAGSIILPSTKRAHFDPNDLQRLEDRISSSQPATAEGQEEGPRPGAIKNGPQTGAGDAPSPDGTPRDLKKEFILPGSKSGIVVRPGSLEAAHELLGAPTTKPAAEHD